MKKFFSFLHLTIGQEAGAVGVISALLPEDIAMGNHRSHGHYLAKGGDLPKMIYEVFGDQRGCCGGFGGSMHMLDRSVNFNGSTPILGGSIPPLAVGQAFASKESGINNVTAVFLGDGAAEEGVFMESVNLAANKNATLFLLLKIIDIRWPLLILDRKSDAYSHKKLFEGLGKHYIRENGQNVLDVYKTAIKARNEALKGKKPVVLHLDLLRRHGHSGPMKENENADYRNEDTLDYRNQNDCLLIARTEAINSGISEEEVDVWIKSAQEETLETVIQTKETINVRDIS